MLEVKDFQVGDRVKHTLVGLATIVEIEDCIVGPLIKLKCDKEHHPGCVMWDALPEFMAFLSRPTKAISLVVVRR